MRYIVSQSDQPCSSRAFVRAATSFTHGCAAQGHSQRFASAAVIYGVMDWTSQTLTVDRPDYFGYFRAPAPPWAEGMHEHYWRRSPLSLVDKVRTPTIVLCGEKDARTPLGQSEMYFTALKLCAWTRRWCATPTTTTASSGTPAICST